MVSILKNLFRVARMVSILKSLLRVISRVVSMVPMLLCIGYLAPYTYKCP